MNVVEFNGGIAMKRIIWGLLLVAGLAALPGC
jgi:hypothetical protein